MKSKVLFSVVAQLAVAGANARAESAQPARRCVEVLSGTCAISPVDRKAFVAALQVELASGGFEVKSARCTPEGYQLWMEPVSCDTNASAVTVTLVAPSGVRVVRQVAVDALAPPMRARTLALASAELVASSDAAAGAAPEEAAATSPLISPETPPAVSSPAPMPPPAPIVLPPEVRGPPPPTTMIAGRSRRSPLAMLGVEAEYRNYVTPSTSLFGGRVVSAWHGPVKPIEFRGDLGAATGGRDVALGQVALHVVSAALGAMWVVGDEQHSLALGPMAEVGYAWASGQSSATAEGGSGGHWSAALLGDVGFRIAWARHWLAVFELGVGGELAGIRAFADDTHVAGVSGFLIQGRAGVAFTP